MDYSSNIKYHYMNNYYPYLDILKIISCIGVVAIHTRPFEFSVLNAAFTNVCPIFVAIFFICSSILLWEKITWDTNDKAILKKFVKRLFSLYFVWNIILSPYWIHSLIKEFPNDWFLHLPVELLLNGGAYGSWFILSLVYGFIICYILNKYLNRGSVAVFILVICCYYSLVHYAGMNDYLGIYWQSDYITTPYFSPLRALMWVELAYILNRYKSHIKQLYKPSFHFVILLSVAIYLCISLIRICSIYQFVFNIIIVTIIIIWSMTKTDNIKEYKYIPLLRNCTIIIYFVHFIFERELFKILGFGWGNFYITITLSLILSMGIVLLSQKYSFLKYLY